MPKPLCHVLLVGCLFTGAACEGSHSLRDPPYPGSQYAKTSNKEIITLGQKLFFDPQLSESGRTACATCHNPDFAYGDPRPVSLSDNGQPGLRNAPSAFTVVFGRTSFGTGASVHLRHRPSVLSDRMAKWG